MAFMAGLAIHSGAAGASAPTPKPTPPKLPSSPGIAKLTQWTLPPEDLYPYAIAAGPSAGPDQMWFTAGRGQPGLTAIEQKVEPVIGRISFGGEIREFSPPNLSLVPTRNSITAGNDGAMWFLGQGSVGRITQDGQLTSFPIDTGGSGGAITSGSDGNLWFTKSDASGRGAIVRLTLSGQATEFPIGEPGSAPESIVPGPDGSLWFTEAGTERIGRITPAGAITEFPIRSRPTDLVAGHDGNLWYSTDGAIGHVSTAGKSLSSILVEGGYGPLAAGPDLRLWFGDARFPLGLGRVTPDGRRSLTELPSGARWVVDLATGTLGSLWYIARAEGPCMGGGGSCQISRPSQPGVIGLIQQSHPVVVIKRRGFSIHERWAGVRLGCFGGEALGTCRGELTLRSRAGVVFGHRRFRIRTDDAATIPIRLLREGREAVLDGRRLRLVAHVDHPEGTPTSRAFVVPPKPVP
jgi:virginiamycin B lyase